MPVPHVWVMTIEEEPVPEEQQVPEDEVRGGHAAYANTQGDCVLAVVLHPVM